MILPHFRYHPAPPKTGMILPSDEECACLGEARGYNCVVPAY